MILDKLDRGLASEDWFVLFSKVCEKHLTTLYSDHVPILFYISDQQQVARERKRTFRFENMWVRHKGCKATILDG